MRATGLNLAPDPVSGQWIINIATTDKRRIVKDALMDAR